VKGMIKKEKKLIIIKDIWISTEKGKTPSQNKQNLSL